MFRPINPDPQQDSSTLVNKILQFINTIKQFKQSNLAENHEILSIYQKKDQYLNLHPTIWQTFIYSIRKFNQQPFDTGKLVFEIMFYTIFMPYFIQKKFLEVENCTNLEDKFLNQKQILPSSQDTEISNKTEPLSIFDKVLEILKIKLPFTFREWVKDNFEQIKEAKISSISKEQVLALVHEIKNSKQLLTLQYISNVHWMLVMLFSRQQAFKFSTTLFYHTICKHESFSSIKLNTLDAEISRYTRKKLQVHTVFTYTEFKNMKPIKFLRLIKNSFCFLKIDQSSSTDLRVYMHTLHLAAEKRRNHMISDMIKSKCFICETQRYSTNSIHKIRIYQCLSRQLLNALTQSDEKVEHLIDKSPNSKKQNFLFDSQEQKEY